MNVYEQLGRQVGDVLDALIESLGHGNPDDFYRANKLRRKIWRIKKGQSFSSAGLKNILDIASENTSKSA